MALDIPLMEYNVTREDLNQVIEFLRQDPPPILTNSSRCREFEELWSKWLGVKYSVFINSGSAANTITMEIVRDLFGKGEIITPPLTWVSDILAVLRAGHTPVFTDINQHNLCMDEKQIIAKLTDKTKAVFLTHILGFNGLSDNLLDTLKKRNIALIEDVCESHGATFRGKKLGSFGLISNFSFYFAHHMSTIEGGMVCTNDEKVYQLARMYRSHGMTREITDQGLKDEWSNKHPDLRPEFIFAYPGYNFRSTEINAVIGLNQLKYLDRNNEIRRENLKLFLSSLDGTKYYTDFDIEGSCNYAFVLLLKKQDRDFCNRVIKRLQSEKVEFRRGTAGGGNHLRQPYLKKMLGEIDPSLYPVVDYVHFYGFYIGNYPSLPKEKIRKLCQILNEIE